MRPEGETSSYHSIDLTCRCRSIPASYRMEPCDDAWGLFRLVTWLQRSRGGASGR